MPLLRHVHPSTKYLLCSKQYLITFIPFNLFVSRLLYLFAFMLLALGAYRANIGFILRRDKGEMS